MKIGSLRPSYSFTDSFVDTPSPPAPIPAPKPAPTPAPIPTLDGLTSKAPHGPLHLAPVLDPADVTLGLGPGVHGDVTHRAVDVALGLVINNLSDWSVRIIMGSG